MASSEDPTLIEEKEMSEEEKAAQFHLTMKHYGHFLKYLTQGESFGDLGIFFRELRKDFNTFISFSSFGTWKHQISNSFM